MAEEERALTALESLVELLELRKRASGKEELHFVEWLKTPEGCMEIDNLIAESERS